MTFEREIANVYRLKVPFDNIYTSVFLIQTEKGNVLVDCATYASDVDGYIAPALSRFGLKWTDIRYLIITHRHSDHAGGKDRILEYAPHLEVVQSVQPISIKGITVCALKGHTPDCIGVFDERTETLISGDGLQGNGVGKYRCSLKSKEDYLSTIENLEENERIKNILFSHAYEPWKRCGAFGREEVEKVLKDCKEIVIKGEM
ncbi:MAG: MBL fold metallo-hydrolase [Clostridia bacterium]|nr:MBL fold metallo-hydrolase [Clostridia bacterium]